MIARAHARRGAARRLVLLLGLLGACGAGARNEPAMTARAIVNGDPDPADPAVVAIGLRRIGCADALSVHCTGTLIAPRLILTAAHCVSDPRLGSNLEVLFGGDAAEPGAKVLRVSAVHVHPDYHADGDPADLAVLLLDEPAPAEAVSLPTQPLTGAAGQSVRIVGFGQTHAAGEPPRTKRSGTARISEVHSADFLIAPGPALSCRGDSGGPLFGTESGREVLIGVTSTGDPGCATYGRNVRTDAFRGFITQWIAASSAMSSPPPRDAILDGEALCSAPCARDADCPLGLVCEPGPTGQGLAPRCLIPGLAAGALTDPCTRDTECSERCVRILSNSAPTPCRCYRSCSAPDELPKGNGCSLRSARSPSGNGIFLLSFLLLFLLKARPAARSPSHPRRASCRRQSVSNKVLTNPEGDWQ
jgi:hypothetical protein